jgi:putative membrane protein
MAPPAELSRLEGAHVKDAEGNSTRRRPSSPLAGTIFISLAAYGVLGYALSTNPPDVLPPLVSRALAVFPHLIAAVNATALICLLAGWRAIRAGSVVAHRRLMLASVMLISAFLILYVARVALGGTKTFPGPSEIRRYVYLPALTVHIALSILSVPPVIYNVLVGMTYPLRDVGKTQHPRVGRIAVTLWSTSLALGLLVYLLLNIVY